MESDFEEGGLVRGFISKFKKSKKSKNKTRALVFLESMAGNTWVCKRDFEDSGRDISQYSEGDSILLKKIGYYKDDDITKWQIL